MGDAVPYPLVRFLVFVEQVNIAEFGGDIVLTNRTKIDHFPCSQSTVQLVSFKPVIIYRSAI